MLILALIAALAAAPGDGKTMAHDDWHAMTILGVASGLPAGSPYYLNVKTGDLDGDGRADEAYVRLVCADGGNPDPMAKTPTEAPGTSGSQFFIVTGADIGLPPEYAVIGKVTDGLDVVDKIGRLGDAATEEPTQVVVISEMRLADAK